MATPPKMITAVRNELGESGHTAGEVRFAPVALAPAGEEAIVLVGEAAPSRTPSLVNDFTTRMPASVSSTCALMSPMRSLLHLERVFMRRLK